MEKFHRFYTKQNKKLGVKFVFGGQITSRIDVLSSPIVSQCFISQSCLFILPITQKKTSIVSHQ